MILVSVVVVTYNQIDYIRQALDSVVHQETTFPYEVLVYDDASTDGTREVVLEYARNYPNLIVPILPEENQQSKGVKKYPKFILPRARGKYLAYNEGDDFWTDNHKLQKQVDYIEAHDDCSMVVHQSNQVREDGSFLRITPTPITEGDYSVEDVLLHHTYFTTNSVLMRTNIRTDNPKIYHNCSNFDYLSKAVAVFHGRIHTLPDNMSCYRVMAKGSWSQLVTLDPKKHYDHLLDSIHTFEYLDCYYQYEHHDAIQKAIDYRTFEAHCANGNTKELRHEKFKAIFRSLPLKRKLYTLVKIYAPWLIRILRKHRGR